MTRITRYILTLAVVTAPLGSAGQAVAQSASWDPQQVELSRTELDSLLTRYTETANSDAYSSDLREQARQEASLIRTRLAAGDFQVGDQIALAVEGEEALTNTFTVQAGPSLVLPQIGSISLAGVLRAELEHHLRTELARYIRDPVVQTRSSMRLMVSGGVGKAGYHVVPTNTVFSDVLMIAGGPTSSAVIREIRVERGDELIWEGEALQQAIIEGRTLDQLSIRAGDHIVVPIEGESGGLGSIARTTLSIVGPLILIAGSLARIF